jgi:hypothetical protein
MIHAYFTYIGVQTKLLMQLLRRSGSKQKPSPPILPGLGLKYAVKLRTEYKTLLVMFS